MELSVVVNEIWIWCKRLVKFSYIQTHLSYIQTTSVFFTVLFPLLLSHPGGGFGLFSNCVYVDY